MLFHVIFGVYSLLMGLIVGSYLNVVVYRLPRGLSTVLPRSRCPSCGAAIRPFDNLPVLSYLILGGRCRSCRQSISWRYPLLEAITGLLFVACFERFGFAPEALAAAVFCALMVVLAAIDAEHLIRPDRITLPGIVLGLAIQPWLDWGVGLRSGAIGAALGAAIPLAIWGLWYLVRHEEGMGLGDVKMLAMVGAFLGWKGVLVTLFFGALTGAATGLALLRRSGAGLKSKLPFGTFLALGGLLALFAGQAIADAYLGLL